MRDDRPVRAAALCAIAGAALAALAVSCTLASAGTALVQGGATSSTGGGPCTPGETRPCYDGPDGTEGIGICHAGEETCLADGGGFGECVGAVLPGIEDCGTPYDQNCNGDPNDGCGCTGTETKPCYTGPPATKDVGSCTSGVETCSGGQFGACEGEILPKPVEDCVSGVDDACDGTTPCSGATIWATPVDVGGEDRVEAAAVDAQGATVLVGMTNLAMNGQNLVEGDVLAAKVDAAGAVVWKKAFVAPGVESAYAVGVDSQGDVLVGGMVRTTVSFGAITVTPAKDGTDNAFLAKLSGATGAPIWAFAIGSDGNYSQVRGLAVRPSGGIVVIGWTGGQIDFGGGPLTSSGGADLFVAEYGGDGAYVSGDVHGDAAHQVGWSIALDASGGYVATGWNQGTVQLGKSGPSEVALSANDGFLAKVDANGDGVYAVRLGDLGTEGSVDVDVAADGSAIVSGAFYASTMVLPNGPYVATEWDTYAARYDTAGAPIWAHVLAGPSSQLSTGAGLDAFGNVFLPGFYQTSIDFADGDGPHLGQTKNVDAFAAKLSSSGGPVWGATYNLTDANASGFAAFRQGLAAPDGTLRAVGHFSGAYDFGTGEIASAGGLADVIVVAMKP